MFLLHYVDGLVQERRNSIANAMELRLSCTNSTICEPAVLFLGLAILSLRIYCSLLIPCQVCSSRQGYGLGSCYMAIIQVGLGNWVEKRQTLITWPLSNDIIIYKGREVVQLSEMILRWGNVDFVTNFMAIIKLHHYLHRAKWFRCVKWH